MTDAFGDLIELPRIDDLRGSLSFVQDGDHLPFPVKRIYYMYDIYNRAVRGGHAHKMQDTVLIPVSGRFTAKLMNRSQERVHVMDKPNMGLRVPPLTWIELSEFSAAAVCIALASTLYDPNDYIRSFDAYLSFVYELSEDHR